MIEDSPTKGGKNVTYMKQNANYSMSSTEDYVNSGWLLPTGKRVYILDLELVLL